jgi:hypothetical protein
LPASFSDLKTSIKNLLKRGSFYDQSIPPVDVTDATVGTFVNFGLKSLQRSVTVKQAVEVSVNFLVGPTAGGGVSNHPFPLTSLPYPFRFGYDLWANSAGLGVTPVQPLKRYNDIREYHDDWPSPALGVPGAITAGAPRGYVIFNNSLYLGPYPDINYTLIWDYVMWMPNLINPQDFNWYTYNAEDAVTYLACKEAAAWLQDDSLIQLYDGLAKAKVSEVLKVLREEEVSEGQLVAQLPG